MKKVFLCGFSLLLACSFANAEVVTNSKGDRVELKSNGTWVLVPWTDADFVNDGEEFTINALDGNDNNVSVVVTPNISLQDDGRRLKRKDLEQEVRIASITGKYQLKDRYSYMPRDVSVKQRGNNIIIMISSTAKNSYGADVPSTLTKEYYIEKNGKLANKSIKDL